MEWLSGRVADSLVADKGPHPWVHFSKVSHLCSLTMSSPTQPFKSDVREVTPFLFRELIASGSDRSGKAGPFSPPEFMDRSSTDISTRTLLTCWVYC